MLGRVRRVLFSGLLIGVTSAFAQAQGPGNCSPGPGSQMGFPDGGGPPGHRPPGGAPGADGTSSTMRGGLQLGPPGRWWDDPMFSRDLGLSPKQKSKMDDIFNARKAEIFGAYSSLLSEEATLEKMTQEAHPDEAGLFLAIDRVAQARASLEKANARMLLAVRREMDDKQLERLGNHRHSLSPGPGHPGN